jgi:hypothetical protein
MVSQSALELLAWITVVEERNVVSGEGFDKLPASDRLRVLLEVLGIPRTLPAGLTALQKASEEAPKGGPGPWTDGPHALTDLRNVVVHPTKKRRTLGAVDLPWDDAARLSRWYVELVLLRLMGYDGMYLSRLTYSSEPVPWTLKAPVDPPGADGTT